MKFAVKSIVAAAAFAAGLANAAPFNLAVGESITSMGWQAGELTGTVQWNLDTRFVGQLNSLLGDPSTQVSSVAPAVLRTKLKYMPRQHQFKTISVAAPVQSLTGAFDGTSTSIYSIQSRGGVSFTITEEDGFALYNSGAESGFLAISNLRVDLPFKTIYADLDGLNGLGVKTNVALWDFKTSTDASSFLAVEGKTVFINTVSGLNIKAPAYAMLVQALGLGDWGESLLGWGSGFIDYGTITTTLSISTPSVPEPSAYAMICVGLLVVGAVGRRRKASAPQPTKAHEG